MLLADRRTRATIVLVGVLLIGGTGCITTALVSQARQRNHLRDIENRRQARIAALAPAAEAGDAVAMRRVAANLLAAAELDTPTVRRALALLEKAAGLGDADAQAMLGQMLITGKISSRYNAPTLPSTPGDRERGAALLRQAATRACRFAGDPEDPGYRVFPAPQLTSYHEAQRDERQAALWQARGILHCGVPNVRSLAWRGTQEGSTPAQRIDALSWLLLAGDAEHAGHVKARLAPADIAIAEEKAAELRRLVAASEQQYPAPPRKTSP